MTARVRKTKDKRNPNDSLTLFALGLHREYESQTSPADRKARGQFFTPPEVARFMAGLVGPVPEMFRLLDPGAGIGILTAAVCDRLRQLNSPRRIDLQVFENDDGVLPLLRTNLIRCAEVLSAAGHKVSYEIHTKDFILDTAATTFGQQPSLFSASRPVGPFDAVIMNPPYFKLAKDSPQARIMRDVVHGQPNIYAFFLALVL